MQVTAAEISNLIKDRIADFNPQAQTRTEGQIVSVRDGIIRIHGLDDVAYGEMIQLPGDVYGMALNLEQDSVGVVVLGDASHIAEG